MEQLKSNRETLEANIKNMAFDLKSPFLSALAQDGAINEPAISVELLGKAFAPLEQQVKDSLEKQEVLVTAIQQNSDEYFGRKPGTDTLSRRDQAMRQLAEGYDSFMDLQNNLKEGTKFYNDLTQVNIHYKIQTKSDSLVFKMVLILGFKCSFYLHSKTKLEIFVSPEKLRRKNF